MNHNVVIEGDVLNLVKEMEKSGHRVGVSRNDACSGNSHTALNVRVYVRTPNEAGNIATIEYLAIRSYGFGYNFQRCGVTPAFTSDRVRLDDYGLELGVKALVADANAIRDIHMALKGVEYKERARRAVAESALMESACT